MRIVYLGLGYPVKGDQNIYTDLMKEFLAHDHSITVVCSNEKVDTPDVTREDENGIDVVRVRTGSVLGNVSAIRKGISTCTVDWYYVGAIKKVLRNEHYDLILCSTPPITLIGTLRYLKKLNTAPVYLMLKDIFPQNAVDIGMMKKDPILYGHFRHVEKKLYKLSDYIGCMSEANIRYVLTHNRRIDESSVVLCVNSLKDIPLHPINAEEIRRRYNITAEKTVFLYGGNLGKPQGIEFLVRFLQKQVDKKDRVFIICGKGKEAYRVADYVRDAKPENVKYYDWLPYTEFNELSMACDVGMILLNHQFTIPNFPSRMISAMRSGLPVFAATDTATDVGEKIYDGDFGWWCPSDDVDAMCRLANEVCADKDKIQKKGKRAREYFLKHYTSHVTYQQIMEQLEKT